MEGVASAGRAVEALPELAALGRALDQGNEPTAEAILAAARAVVETPGVIEACVDRLVSAARADPFFRPPLRSVSSAVRSGMILFERPALSLLLASVTPDDLAGKRSYAEGPSSITFTGDRSLIHFVEAGGAVLSFWEAPAWDEAFSSVGAEPCRLVERRPVRDGETIEVDGRRQGFVIDHLRSTMVYVQAVTRVGGAALSREYDSRSLAFVGASSTDDAGSRTGLFLTLLRDMDRHDAIPLFERTIREGDFHARWHAMRELLALDCDAALPLLKAMAQSDPHPEVRAAAHQTLAAFFPEDAEMDEPESCPA
jgi:hypothetical protein